MTPSVPSSTEPELWFVCHPDYSTSASVSARLASLLLKAYILYPFLFNISSPCHHVCMFSNVSFTFLHVSSVNVLWSVKTSMLRLLRKSVSRITSLKYILWCGCLFWTTITNWLSDFDQIWSKCQGYILVYNLFDKSKYKILRLKHNVSIQLFS